MRDRVPAKSRYLRSQLKALHSASVRVRTAEVARIMAEMPAEPRAILCMLQYAGRFRGWEQRVEELRQLRAQRIEWAEASKPPANVCLFCSIDDHDNCVRVQTGQRGACECCEEQCPACKSNSFEETTIGHMAGAPNPNRRTCMQCKTQWYTPERVAQKAAQEAAWS